MSLHWASEKEITQKLKRIKEGEKLTKSGIPLSHIKNELLIDDSESHNLIVGSIGSGKTQGIILPMIRLSLQAQESIVINDPQGELYRKCASSFEKMKYRIVVLDFNDAVYGDNWNPLSTIYDFYHNNKKDLAIRMLEDLGYYLFYENNQNIDPFWINTTIDYFSGLVLYLIEKAKKEELNILSVYNLSNQIKNNKKESIMKEIDSNSVIYMNLVGTLEAPPETKESILSVFNQKMKKYITRINITNMICNKSFDIDDIFEEKTALFILSGSTDYSHNLIPLLISQIIEFANNFQNKKRINLLLDEFDSMIPIKNFSEKIQRCRSLNLRFTVTIKSYANLDYQYSKEDSKILRYCFGNIIYLLSNDIPTLEEISKYCGTKKVNGQIEPLISVEELRTLKPFETIISMMRMMPIKSELLPDYKIYGDYQETEKELPMRETKKVKIYEI